jgi:hypothetical protein
VIVNTPGDNSEASGCDATTVTVEGGGDGFVTVIVWLALLVCPALLATVKVTVKLPALLYVCEGFCAELDAPSPKSQLQETTAPLDWSVNCTLSGAWPELGLAEKPALTGGGGLATAMVWLALLVWPLLPVTVKVNVKLPALL